ncbi:MAG: excinuclease ABC subunit A [Bacteroidetes bacterium]|nr:MAG: excinuclease ABC subunit A [Bacteroidota bacterium]
MNKEIKIIGASEHNLKNIDVSVEHNTITVVTGVSGSGKSSLVYDIICNEGQRRYLESFSTHARQYLKRLKRPEVTKITGLPPAISVNQKTVTRNPRSTVGTMSELYDYLRLLFARSGKPEQPIDKKIERRLFSFNSPYGACPVCKGLGVEDKIDVNKIVEDDTKTLREGALVITTSSGYTIYSQVTIDVMNQLCNAHGFNVDIPWKKLNEEQKKIILYGSDIIKIPFGKHTLESRMKWSGITAKPREEGYYKGIIPVMEDILKRDRNKNILRFVTTQKCSSCNGKRLNKEALNVKYKGRNIADFTEMTIEELHHYFNLIKFNPNEEKVASPIRNEIVKRTNLLIKLGLAYLSLNRESTTLSGGEAQRIRLVNQVVVQLRGVLFVLDEPSIGLHSRDNKKLLSVLQELVSNGNTVLIVEHDEETIRNADRIIDIGPYAGVNGGELLFSGKTEDFFNKKNIKSITHEFLTRKQEIKIPETRRKANGKFIKISGANHHNLKNINVEFPLGVLTVVTGVSGAGKSSLVHGILANKIKKELHKTLNLSVGKYTEIQGIEHISKLIEIDQSPIGRTPRSNPATYTKLFDYIRELFAELPEAKEKKWKKGRFSFNNKGGRCETCQGAGVIQIGMHFMGNVDVICNKCKGKRFNPETLSVKYTGKKITQKNYIKEELKDSFFQKTAGSRQSTISKLQTAENILPTENINSDKLSVSKNIYEILEMTVDNACEFFKDQTKLMQYLSTLQALGLGYITLGQPATTLSGGEAQRVKLASELSKNTKGHTLYILDEPTTGLHFYDINILLKSLQKLVDAGNSVIIIEHHIDIIKSADYIIDLGPESGAKGGELVAYGTPEEVIKNEKSLIGKELKLIFDKTLHPQKSKKQYNTLSPIEFKSISTHNLKNINVSIPVNQLTVVTGVSGSGKSSLVFDTIFAEGQKLYSESLSSYLRTFVKQKGDARFEGVKGMTPAVAINQNSITQNPRSTLGTVTEIYDYYRLLYSRAGTAYCPECGNKLINGKCEICKFTGFETLTTSLFSFNHEHGACPVCKGLGYKIVCDPDKLVSDPNLALGNGAMNAHKTGKFYGDPFGQYIATLNEVGKQHSVDFSLPWNKLSPEAQQIAMNGTKSQIYEVLWHHKRKNKEGTHKFKTEWKGFISLVNEEFERKHADKRGDDMLPIMKHEECETCKGTRLNKEAISVKFAEKNIAQLSALSVKDSISFFNSLEEKISNSNLFQIIADIRKELLNRLNVLNNIGLSYLTIDRRSNTLSGGEARRMRLAGQIVSGLTGISYVLDEPSIGLHRKDTKKLIQLLYKLRDEGNTVIVTEHDAEIINSADYIIDLGPGAGKNGGKIIAEGNLQSIISNKNSLTGKFLKKPLNVIRKKRTLQKGISIEQAYANNLKNIDVNFPSEGIIALTGVSGSGKSSLLFDVLYKSAQTKRPINCKNITGFELFDKIIHVNQSLPGKSTTSNLATYLSFFDTVRDLFANLPQTKEQGIKKSYFSFNTKGGRCETCKGTGKIKISMDFLADVYTLCEDCKGKRFQDNILNIKYKEKSIYDILQFTVTEATHFFSDNKKLLPYFKILSEIGLDYLTLGQSLNTFSGGELQRLKLASSLIEKKKGNNLYLLDEPSTGLHFKDIETLLKLMNNMTETGHTIIIIEHNQDIIRHADYVIELGPEGGDLGGNIVKTFINN